MFAPCLLDRSLPRAFTRLAGANLLAAWLVAFSAASAADENGDFNGEWKTSIGVVKLEQQGADVTGTYGDAGQFTLKGKVQGDKLIFDYQEGQARGNGSWSLDKTGHSFHGEFRVQGGRSGVWNGWRPDPAAPKDKAPKFAGLWLTDLGLMQLTPSDAKITGKYAQYGVAELDGKLSGRNFEFTYKAFRPGRGWFDLAADGQTFSGAANTDGFPGRYGWQGRRAPEFALHAKLAPAKIVDGSTTNLLTYSVRAPSGFKPGDPRKWPAIVVLHGSNMNGRAYVNTLASAWPEIAKNYLLIGINGETPSDTGKDPRFNYSYVSYVGRSTFKGFPGTDRESPALVAEALEDLRKAYPISRYFVGGHSQGAFLTYSLLMNFPELIAGAFPVSGGVIFQCEPSAYADEKLRAKQRTVPLAIVHGQGDPSVDFSSGEYSAALFGEAGWPALRFFADDQGAGHMFARLPVDDAIRWLEAQASTDPVKLAAFAEKRLKAEGGARDAVAAVNRAGKLKTKPSGATQQKLDRLATEIDQKGRQGAADLFPKINADNGPEWIDALLAYRDDYEFAPAAGDVMVKFNALRKQQDPPATKLLNEARAAFQQGKRDQGYSKYQEIIDKYPAASSYRNVKKWIAERK